MSEENATTIKATSATFSQAEVFQGIFESQSRDGNGFLALSPAQLLCGFDFLLINTPDPQSTDPSWTVLFTDYSVAHVDNPHQECFSGNVSIPDLDDLRHQLTDKDWARYYLAVLDWDGLTTPHSN
jgi:hypothetical protein